MRWLPTLITIVLAWAWLMFHALLVLAIVVSLRSKRGRQ